MYNDVSELSAVVQEISVACIIIFIFVLCLVFFLGMIIDFDMK